MAQTESRVPEKLRQLHWKYNNPATLNERRRSELESPDACRIVDVILDLQELKVITGISMDDLMKNLIEAGHNSLFFPRRFIAKKLADVAMDIAGTTPTPQPA